MRGISAYFEIAKVFDFWHLFDKWNWEEWNFFAIENKFDKLMGYSFFSFVAVVHFPVHDIIMS